MATQSLNLSCTAQFYSKIRNESYQGKANLWKSCAWKRERDGATCTIEAKDDLKFNEIECDKRLVGVKHSKTKRNECRIEIPNIKENDQGNWTCVIEKCNDQNLGGCEHKDSGSCTDKNTIFVRVKYLSNQKFELSK